MNDYDKRLSTASEILSKNAVRLITLILQKHDAAVIEGSIEAIESAVAAEREACAILCEQMGEQGYGTLAAAAAIRTRGDHG